MPNVTHPAVQFHDARADSWQAAYGRKGFGSRVEAVQSVLAGADLRGQYWLDAGCGTGNLSRLLCGKGATVLGVDASPKMIQCARENVIDQNNVTFDRIATIESLPWPNATFDGILCSSVMEYVDNPLQCLAEMVRVSKERARILVSVPNQLSLVRQMLKLSFLASRLVLRRGMPAYMALSKNEFTHHAFETVLTEFGLQLDHHVYFGELFRGRWSSAAAIGTLEFFLATKRAGVT